MNYNGISNSLRGKSIIYLVLTAILWSTGGILIKQVNWNPVAIAGTRSAIAALLMLCVIKKPSLKWSKVKIGGSIAYAGTVILFISANKMTTAANAILLQYTAPIYVALLGSWFLKEKTTAVDWITIFFVLGGMILFFIDDINAGSIWGNIIAILSGISFAAQALLIRKQKDGSPVDSVFWGNVFTAIIAIPFMFKGTPNANGWTNLILLGIFQLGIPYLLYSYAIKHVTALEVIMIPILEPILNPVWVFLFIGEKPGKWAVAGGIIVVASIVARCLILTRKAARI